MNNNVYEKLGSLESSLQAVKDDIGELKTSIDAMSNAVYKGNGKSILSRVEKLETKSEFKKENLVSWNIWLNLIAICIMWAVGFGFSTYKYKNPNPEPKQKVEQPTTQTSTDYTGTHFKLDKKN